MRKEQDIHARLPEGVKKEAKLYAAKDCRNLSGFVETAIREKIARMKEIERLSTA